MVNSPIFITGTDTGVGKTVFCTALINALVQRHVQVMAYKPVATGCTRFADGYRNADALRIQQTLPERYPYAIINPWAYQPAIAPHIAASEVGETLSAAAIAEHCQQIDTDICLIEGAGGLLVPLNATETMLDIAVLLKAKIIVVVGLKVGCINHSLLTLTYLRTHHPDLLFEWVANPLSNTLHAQAEIIDAISLHMGAPPLAVLSFAENPEIPQQLITWLL